MAQSPETNAATSEIVRYDLGWNAINSMLRAGRSLSGHERNCCFLNVDNDRFANVSAVAGLDFVDDGRVLALSDWDYDGDVDFWIANRSGPQIRFVRNEIGAENRFLALALTGVESNRDAIGAKIQVHMKANGDSPSIQTQSLKAGEGYLSQNSKWLHFGLGSADVQSVVVRWPSGREQSFDGLTSNGFYRLTEGNESAERWIPPQALRQPSGRELVSSEFTAPPVSDTARIVLLAPLPLPKLAYRGPDGTTLAVNRQSDQARLVNLWTTWCQPCLAELAEWSQHAAELKAAGLEIIAINLDEDEHDSTPARVASVLESLKLPFSTGTGSSELAAQFDVLQRSLLSRQRPLPVPSSFLVDRNGRLRILYKGAVPADVLLRDAKLVDAEGEEILRAATPFPGKWHRPPAGSTPLNLALKFAEGGFNEEAEAYIAGLIAQSSGDDGKKYLSAGLLNLYGAILLDKGDYHEAASAFSQTLSLDPNNRPAHIELGSIQLRFGKGGLAESHFESVIAASRADPELWFKLGMARLQMGKVPEAKTALLTSLELRPNASAHWQLGNAYVRLREFPLAVAEYENACRLQPSLVATANNLAWLLATSSEADVRNGQRALEIAEQICAVAQPNTNSLDTLAAAYAETGDFEQAIQAADRAVASAEATGDTALDAIRQRLSLYRQAKPFRMEP